MTHFCIYQSRLNRRWFWSGSSGIPQLPFCTSLPQAASSRTGINCRRSEKFPRASSGRPLCSAHPGSLSRATFGSALLGYLRQCLFGILKFLRTPSPMGAKFRRQGFLPLVFWAI